MRTIGSTRRTRTRLPAIAAAALLAVGAVLAGPAVGAAAAGGPTTSIPDTAAASAPADGTLASDALAPGTSAQSVFAAPGPYAVASTATVAPCEWPLGQDPVDYEDLVGTVIDAQCTGAFPYGARSPIGVNLYYPEGAAAGQRFPTLVWSPGFITDPGMYDASARLWASHGIVVAVAHDFFNSQPDVPLLGAVALAEANRDPASPLHGRVDLGRTALGGHSAGGAASQRTQGILAQFGHLIDPELRVVSLLAVEPAPGADGGAVTVPALVLTGEDDAVIPALDYPKTEQYDEMRSAPAFFAIARGATHVTPIAPVADNTFAGAATAWLRFTLQDDETAAQFFVGDDWLLASDPDFTGAERNSQAAALG